MTPWRNIWRWSDFKTHAAAAERQPLFFDKYSFYLLCVYTINGTKRHTEPHRAKQRAPHHPNRRQNGTSSSTSNRSETSRSAEATGNQQKAPQDLRINAASLNACTTGAKARRTKQATAEAVPLMLSDRPAANRNRQILL